MRAQISYTGTIHANELAQIVSVWIRNSPNLTINETMVTIDPTCPVNVDSLAPTDYCFREVRHEADTLTKFHVLEISSSVAACLIITGGVLIVACTWCHSKRNHQRKAPKLVYNFNASCQTECPVYYVAIIPLSCHYLSLNLLMHYNYSSQGFI